MAWVENDRSLIREMLGFSAIFLQADPRVEFAITSIQAIADGGTRPDNSSELRMRGYMADYQLILTSLKKLWPVAIATQADDVKIDAARAMAVLRSEGRRIVMRACVMLGVHPRFDVFSSQEYNPSGTPWPDFDPGQTGGLPEAGFD